MKTILLLSMAGTYREEQKARPAEERINTAVIVNLDAIVMKNRAVFIPFDNVDVGVLFRHLGTH